MYNYLIKQYVSRLSLEDIRRLSKSYDIELSEDELIVLYDHMKENIDKFIDDPNYDLFSPIKDSIDPKNFDKLKKMYDDNIDKLR